jgi:PAT family beta-lactamase induction signal transducer AmpG
MLTLLAMGFSSGLPLLLIGSTLKAWLKTSHIDLTVIGLFSLVGLPYTLKFIWSPFLDRYVPPFLGRRRGWIFITQLGLCLAIFALSFTDPTQATAPIVALAMLISFLSATQDIALDAYRREVLETEEFGLGTSVFITGYRLAMIFAGAFALFLADHVSWHVVYSVMAASLSVGILTTLLAVEPIAAGLQAPTSLRQAYIEPFLEYFKRPSALTILLFIVLYKVADSMATEMTMPFYLDLGFSLTTIGKNVKLFGLIATIAGGLVGGTCLIRLGLYRALWIFGILQALANLGFAWLANLGANENALILVISLENITAGMATAAFVTFLASLTNRKFSATQYALLSSLTGVPRVILASPTGFMAKHLGWSGFFVTCTSLALPGLVLLFVLKQKNVFEFTKTPQSLDR